MYIYVCIKRCSVAILAQATLPVLCTVLRLGKQYIHRPLKTTVELHSDTIGAGAFNICCAPKVLKYSATGDPRSELKHAKSLCVLPSQKAQQGVWF